MKKQPSQVQRKTNTGGKQKPGRSRSGWELQANFQLCPLSAGNTGASVIYGPCQVEGGQERREGRPALGWRLGNCGAGEAAVTPGFAGTPQIKHRDTDQQGSAQRENGTEKGL